MREKKIIYYTDSKREINIYVSFTFFNVSMYQFILRKKLSRLLLEENSLKDESLVEIVKIKMQRLN